MPVVSSGCSGVAGTGVGVSGAESGIESGGDGSVVSSGRTIPSYSLESGCAFDMAVKEPIDHFQLLVSHEMLNGIVSCTDQPICFTVYTLPVIL